MKDNGSMKRLMSITMDDPPVVVEDDKKSKSKDREKVAPLAKAGKKGKATVVVEGQYS